MERSWEGVNVGGDRIDTSWVRVLTFCVDSQILSPSGLSISHRPPATFVESCAQHFLIRPGDIATKAGLKRQATDSQGGGSL